MTEGERNKAFKAARSEVLRRRARIQIDTRAEVLRLLQLADRQIRTILGTGATEYQQFMLPQLQQAVRAAMIDWSDQAGATVNGAMVEAAQAGLDLIDQPLAAGGVRVQGLAPVIDTGQLSAMRTFATDRIKDIGSAVTNKINQELGLVVIGAQTPADAASSIAIQLQKGGRGRAITIVRTEVGRAFSVAAQSRYESLRELVPGLMKEWRKSGKIHDRPHHSLINGQRRPVDQPFTLANGVEIMFPRDPKASPGETINCGCESLPYMADWPAAAA